MEDDGILFSTAQGEGHGPGATDQGGIAPTARGQG